MVYEESELIKYANHLIDISKTLKSNPHPEREGGILMITLNNFLSNKKYDIGKADSEKKLKYLDFVQEKSHRLYSNWLRCPEHFFSSFQDRNDDKKKYGGAILLCKGNPFCNIISFSGLAQLTDEAVSLMIGKYLKYGSEDEFKRIADFSKNEVFYEMKSLEMLEKVENTAFNTTL